MGPCLSKNKKGENAITNSSNKVKINPEEKKKRKKKKQQK